MNLYFSGVASLKEAGMLKDAGITNVLADPFDWPNTVGFPCRVLDSGAYIMWKSGKGMDPDSYVRFAKERSEKALWCTMPDIFGDPEGTYRAWQRYRVHGFLVPVWFWGSDKKFLNRYLDDRELVGIGGLVPLMRQKDGRMLDELEALCAMYPRRFHLFGANWLQAIEKLMPLVASIDTSKWLDACRYGHVIFQNTRTRHLSQAPARALKLDWDRRKRAVESAREMVRFCEGELATGECGVKA